MLHFSIPLTQLQSFLLLKKSGKQRSETGEGLVKIKTDNC